MKIAITALILPLLLIMHISLRFAATELFNPDQAQDLIEQYVSADESKDFAKMEDVVPFEIKELVAEVTD